MTLHDWLNLYTTKLGLIFALLVVLYFLRGGEFLPRPARIWVLFRWLGFKDKK